MADTHNYGLPEPYESAVRRYAQAFNCDGGPAYIKAHGGFDAFFHSLFPLWTGKPMTISTYSEMQAAMDTIWAIASIYGPDYGNPSRRVPWRSDNGQVGRYRRAFAPLGKFYYGSLLREMLSVSTCTTCCNPMVDIVLYETGLAAKGYKCKTAQCSPGAREVKLSEIQPGDVVHFFWGNKWFHVAVYYGDGVCYDTGSRWIGRGNCRVRLKDYGATGIRVYRYKQLVNDQKKEDRVEAKKDLFVLDISEHNNGCTRKGNTIINKGKPLDFGKIKAAGVKGVIIRVGMGKSMTDEWFTRNTDAALAAGLRTGFYWFSYAYSSDMARQEARRCLALISRYRDRTTLGVWFDWEYDSDNYAKRNGVSASTSLITDMTLAWMRVVKDAGYPLVGYYANNDYVAHKLVMDRLKDWPLWYAWYNANLNRACAVWQCSSSGSCPGIVSAAVDKNFFQIVPSATPAPTKKTDRVCAALLTALADAGVVLSEDVENSTIAVFVLQWAFGIKPFDGDYGKGTGDAVEAYQERKGLAADRKAGPKTLRARAEDLS